MILIYIYPAGINLNYTKMPYRPKISRKGAR